MAAETRRMKVGFIGLGRMGAGMAARLIERGHDVTVHNRSLSKARELIERGAHDAGRIADACRGEAVVTMLADDAAVEDVVFREAGVLQSLPREAIHVSMSTIGIALADRLAAEHGRAGQRFVSAPVFGRPEVAAQGKLSILAAGPGATIDACMPLFDALGRQTLRVGEKPSGANLIKLAGNFLIASVIEALGEALALVGQAGLERRAFVELLTATLFSCPAYATYGALIIQPASGPAGFTVALGEKDLRLALRAAETLHVPMPLAGLIHDRFLRLIANGGEALDWSALGHLPGEDAGQARAV